MSDDMTDEETTDPLEAPEDGESSDLESHRAIVREVNRKIGAYYGYGGAVAFGMAGAAAGLIGWWRGYISVLPWVLAVVVFLLVMLVLRAVLARAADTEHRRVQQYCDANDVDVEELRDYFGAQAAFPYFEALFEIRERRAQAGRSEQTEDEQDA